MKIVRALIVLASACAIIFAPDAQARHSDKAMPCVSGTAGAIGLALAAPQYRV